MYASEEVYSQYAVELVGGDVSTLDKSPLTTDQIQIAVVLAHLETPPANTTWHVPTYFVQVSSYRVIAMITIGPGQPYPLTPGRYRCWFRITDDPEIAWRENPVNFRVA